MDVRKLCFFETLGPRVMSWSDDKPPNNNNNMPIALAKSWKRILRHFTLHKSFVFHRNMIVFTQKFNPMLSKTEWEEQHENYDFHQEISRSAYADMLHDTERNDKYSNALKVAISQMKAQNRRAIVLDIGTGTGLLSMMAAVHGADKITACEAFQPMANCALAVITKNGFHKKIKVIPKRSTELTVGNGCDLEEKANILVTEVFDTELIGEGALQTFHHALHNLLETDCIVIPTTATVYAQVIESSLVTQWHRPEKVRVSEGNDILPPAIARRCPGVAGAHDVQLTQLPTFDFVPITEPAIALRFDFSGKTALDFSACETNRVEAKSAGTCEAVFMWWELEMLPHGEILSCAPSWAHPAKVAWRDHWLQAIYYLKDPLAVSVGDKFCLNSYHDEYSFWFSVHSSGPDELSAQLPPPVCACGIHTALSHNRIAMLNDKNRNFKFVGALKKVVKPNSVCLSLSDGSLLPLLAAKIGAKKVYSFEAHILIRQVIEAYIKENKLMDKISLFENISELKENAGEKVDIVMADPYFITSILPWDNLYFWSLCSELRHRLSPSVVILPSKATIWGVAVHFLDLWKVRAPVGNVDSFDLVPFDEIIQHSMKISDEKVEPQPLWEYPCIALTEKFEILTFEMAELFQSSASEAAGTIPFQCTDDVNGIALWMDYNLSEDEILSCGPTSPVVPGETISWYRFCQQGVHFMMPSHIYQSMSLKYYAAFSPKSGSINFVFDICQ